MERLVKSPVICKAACTLSELRVGINRHVFLPSSHITEEIELGAVEVVLVFSFSPVGSLLIISLKKRLRSGFSQLKQKRLG